VSPASVHASNGEALRAILKAVVEPHLSFLFEIASWEGHPFTGFVCHKLNFFLPRVAIRRHVGELVRIGDDFIHCVSDFQDSDTRMLDLDNLPSLFRIGSAIATTNRED
jgi:hypothetical protein